MYKMLLRQKQLYQLNKRKRHGLGISRPIQWWKAKLRLRKTRYASTIRKHWKYQPCYFVGEKNLWGTFRFAHQVSFRCKIQGLQWWKPFTENSSWGVKCQNGAQRKQAALVVSILFFTTDVWLCGFCLTLYSSSFTHVLSLILPS